MAKLVQRVLMLRFIAIDERIHGRLRYRFKSKYDVRSRIVLYNPMLQPVPDVYENIHRAAAHHTFFAGFVGG